MTDNSESFISGQENLRFAFVTKRHLSCSRVAKGSASLVFHSIPNIMQSLGLLIFIAVCMFFMNLTKSGVIIGGYGLGYTIFNTTARSIIISLN